MGLTSASYADFLTCGAAAWSVRLMKPRVRLALEWTLEIWGFHESLVLIVTPSRVVVIVSSGDILSIHGICEDAGLPLRGNQEYCALVDIEVHLPHLGPFNESIQVIIQDGMVLWRQYLPVYYAVISEESYRRMYPFGDVTDIQQEEHPRAQDSTLWDSRRNQCRAGCLAIHHYLLAPVS